MLTRKLKVVIFFRRGIFVFTRRMQGSGLDNFGWALLHIQSNQAGAEASQL